LHVAALAALQAARQAGFRRGEYLALGKCGRGGPFLWRRVRKFWIMRLTSSCIEPEVEAFRYLAVGYGRLDASKHFIACASGHSMEGGKQPIHDGDFLLFELVSAVNAGSITGSVVAVERQNESGENQYLLRVVTKSPDGEYVLKANNPDYPDLPAENDMRTLARLKAVINPLEMDIA